MARYVTTPISNYLPVNWSSGVAKYIGKMLTCQGYFWISLHFSLVSVAFLVDFTRKYGRVGFFIYWMANWVTMSGLGFVMETMFLWLGPFL